MMKWSRNVICSSQGDHFLVTLCVFYKLELFFFLFQKESEGAPYNKVCAYCFKGTRKNPTVISSDSRTLVRSGSCENPKDLKNFECKVDE